MELKSALAATLIAGPRENLIAKKDYDFIVKVRDILEAKRNFTYKFEEMNLMKTFPMLSLGSMLYPLRKQYCNILFRLGYDPRQPKSQRKKVVVLGTGWGSMNFIRGVDITKYDVTVISPRSHFSFTPLLPSVCAGVLTSRSCVEPVRNKLLRGGKKVMEFHQGLATEIDSSSKTVKCKSNDGVPFEVNYDYLIMGVGSEVNTFGIPGVEENAFYLKTVTDAKSIHKKLLDCFEKAIIPSVSEAEKKRLLHFIMVGGGPSGVETAAEIADFVQKEGKKHYPELVPYIKVSLIEMLPRLLPVFSSSVSDYTLSTLKKQHVDVHLQTRVTKIDKQAVHVIDSNGKPQELPYGFVLWASGVGQTTFAKHILSSTPTQAHSRIVKVDECLRILGLPGCYAFGDCSWTVPKSLVEDAETLYEKMKASRLSPAKYIKKAEKELVARYPQINSYDKSKLPEQEDMTKMEFIAMLKDIDSSYMPPPPTAQSAQQAAKYLTKIFNTYTKDEDKARAPAHLYHWKGQMSYVGGGNSVIQTPAITILGGYSSLLMWRSVYCIRQMSMTNKMLCIFDWLRTSTRGRDMSQDIYTDTVLKAPAA